MSLYQFVIFDKVVFSVVWIFGILFSSAQNFYSQTTTWKEEITDSLREVTNNYFKWLNWQCRCILCFPASDLFAVIILEQMLQNASCINEIIKYNDLWVAFFLLFWVANCNQTPVSLFTHIVVKKKLSLRINPSAALFSRLQTSEK